MCSVRERAILPLLCVPLLGGCANPGRLVVPLEPAGERIQVAVSDEFRIPADGVTPSGRSIPGIGSKSIVPNNRAAGT